MNIQLIQENYFFLFIKKINLLFLYQLFFNVFNYKNIKKNIKNNL